MNTKIIIGTLLASASLAPFAIAQEAADAEEPRRLNVITVSSLKQDQSIVDVPLSVTAFEGDALEQIGADSLKDVIDLTPGVSVFETRPGSNLVQIRGVSSIVGDATVGYYLDDLPFSLVGQNFQPQGTLYGAGSQGGTIRILTANADPEAFSGKARVTYETVDGGDTGYGFEGALNIPIVEDVFAVRVVAGVSEDPGYVDNSLLGLEDVNSIDREEYRVKFTLRPTDRLELRGSYWYNLAE